MPNDKLKKKTLLEQFFDAKSQQKAINGGISERLLEEYEVAIAWAQGKIDASDAAKLLKLNQSGAMAQKAGTALRNLLAAGYVKLEWLERVEVIDND
jgi:hypothetical protein